MKTIEIKKDKERRLSNTRRMHVNDVLFVILIGFLCFCGALYLMERSGSSSVISGFFGSVRSYFSRSDDEDTQETELVCVSDSVSDAVLTQVRSWMSEDDDLVEAGTVLKEYSGGPLDGCTIIVSSEDEGNYDLVWQKYYSLIANIRSPLQTLTIDEMYRLLGEGGISVGETQYTVIVEQGYLDAIDRTVGVGVGVSEVAGAVSAVSASMTAIGVVPFENVTNAVKEISIDGTRLLAGGGNVYPLVEEVWVRAPEHPDLFGRLQRHLGAVNYDANLVKTVVVTGTSVVGARGWFITSTANGDWTYPLHNVGDILRNASIAHISNEGSRVDGCAQYHWTLVFCGPPAAYDALTWAGVDVIGLTGNHILDYGAASFVSTLDWYDTMGMKYFGGGRTIDEARRAAIVDLGTVKIAFLGYNMIPPADYYAAAAKPGSAPLEETALRTDIARAKEQADVVFVDMQWGNEYERVPNSYQTTYGRIAVDAGATVVSGVHPHWVQPLEYYGNGVIFYGLGNFLFDQTWSQETREGVMVRHFFYGDRYTGFELIPTRIDDEYQLDIVSGADGERITGYVVNGW